MSTMFCTLCRRPVEARRYIGAGTVIIAVVSAGLSLLAIPFYKKRCAICGSTALSANAGVAAIAPEHVEDMERRLRFAEGELEATTAELDRVRTERDFYRQLLGDPGTRGIDPPAKG
jgi:hypothetical protein